MVKIKVSIQPIAPDLVFLPDEIAYRQTIFAKQFSREGKKFLEEIDTENHYDKDAFLSGYHRIALACYWLKIRPYMLQNEGDVARLFKHYKAPIATMNIGSDGKSRAEIFADKSTLYWYDKSTGIMEPGIWHPFDATPDMIWGLVSARIEDIKISLDKLYMQRKLTEADANHIELFRKSGHTIGFRGSERMIQYNPTLTTQEPEPIETISV